MENVYQQIRAVIAKSELTDTEQREFAEIFARTKEQPLKPVLKLFNTDPKWVQILFDNYKEKKRTLVTGSIKEWENVIHSEKSVAK